MSDQTPNLSLPFILPSQAQKHVTHNEALEVLDKVVQLSVKSATETEPPSTVADNDQFIVPASATGAWSGQDGTIAVFFGGAWHYLIPNTGWQSFVEDQANVLAWTGTDWIETGGSNQPADSADTFGINAAADTTNRLAVSAPATLLSHEGQGHQVKINKAGVSDTASLLYQTNWSGRAEMGLAGDDSFSIKVSDDGSNFVTAATAHPATGVFEFPQGAKIDGALTGSALHSVPYGTDGVLVPGSFGLGSDSSLAATALDQAQRSGYYAVDEEDPSSPNFEAGVALVATGGGHIAQLAVNSLGLSLRRSIDNGATWGGWKPLVPTRNWTMTGEVTRFADGTQICIFKKQATVTTTPSGSLHVVEPIGDWTYPKPFSGQPIVTGTVEGAEAWMSLSSSSTIKARPKIVSGAALSGDQITLHLQAIGRYF